MIPILILLSIIATLASYWLYKHPRKSKSTAAYQEYDGVVSLDDDGPTRSQGSVDDASPLPFLFFLVATNFLILFYILFGGKRAVHDEDITYEELAVNQLGKMLTEQLQGGEAAAVLIVPSDSQRTQIYNSMVKSLKKGLGHGIEVVGEESPRIQTTSRMPLPGFSTQYLTASDLNNIVGRYPGIDVVISFAGMLGNSEDVAKSSFPRKLFFVIFAEQGRLYDYLELVHHGIVNIAVVSKGTYESNSLVPKHLSLKDLMKQHFIVITPQNASKLAADYRQYIGTHPLADDPVLGD